MFITFFALVGVKMSNKGKISIGGDMMMKKFTLFLALFVMSLFVVACGGGTSKTDEAPKDQGKVVEENNNGTTNDSNATTDTNKEGTNGTDNQKGSGNADEDHINANEDQITKMNSLEYKDFELKVEYVDFKEYDAELELSQDNRLKAEIEEDGVETKGSEAFDKLYPLVEKLTITADTSKEEAIQEVLTVFNLDSNYEEFELEIKFKDDTKIEFKDQKQ